MSKIFSIFGNYIKNGDWASPEFAFEGEIVTDDIGALYGYCHQNYEISYLAGALTKDGSHKDYLELYMMPDNQNNPPMLYGVPDLEAGHGHWSEILRYSPASWKISDKKGEAKIKLQLQDYSETKEAYIKDQFSRIRVPSLIGLRDCLHPRIADNIIDAIY